MRESFVKSILYRTVVHLCQGSHSDVEIIERCDNNPNTKKIVVECTREELFKRLEFLDRFGYKAHHYTVDHSAPAPSFELWLANPDNWKFAILNVTFKEN